MHGGDQIQLGMRLMQFLARAIVFLVVNPISICVKQAVLQLCAIMPLSELVLPKIDALQREQQHLRIIRKTRFSILQIIVLDSIRTILGTNLIQAHELDRISQRVTYRAAVQTTLLFLLDSRLLSLLHLWKQRTVGVCHELIVRGIIRLRPPCEKSVQFVFILVHIRAAALLRISIDQHMQLIATRC